MGVCVCVSVCERVSVCVCEREYVYVCVCERVCVCVCESMCVWVYVCVWEYVSEREWVIVCVFVCVYVRVCVRGCWLLLVSVSIWQLLYQSMCASQVLLVYVCINCYMFVCYLLPFIEEVMIASRFYQLKTYLIIVENIGHCIHFVREKKQEIKETEWKNKIEKTREHSRENKHDRQRGQHIHVSTCTYLWLYITLQSAGILSPCKFE